MQLRSQWAYNASRQAAETQGAPIHTELVSAYQKELDVWAGDLDCSSYYHRTAIRRFEPEATCKQKLIQQVKQEHRQKLNMVLDVGRDGDLPTLSELDGIDFTQHPFYPELTALLLLRVEREPPA